MKLLKSLIVAILFLSTVVHADSKNELLFYVGITRAKENLYITQIGNDNKFVTFQTGQMKLFRDLTLKTPVIMGRKTQDYINFPLDQRVCITITDHKDKVIDGFVHAKSLKHALSISNIYDTKIISIIGGQSIFEQALLFADEIILIEVKNKK